jgi:hypothetical protein
MESEKRNAMRRTRIIVGAVSAITLLSWGVLLSGCTLYRAAAQSAEPVEATFADPDSVMIRAIEPVTVKAEYYDRTAKSVKVKNWVVRPPFWIVNDAMLKARKAAREPETKPVK